uniref:C-factor-like n=1 Tax=Varanus komodoensis TaxID=61221 RepID=A0A8D2L4H0_VARKO
MDVPMARSVLVTGSNRGIGLELVKQLVAASNRPQWIFATCRDPDGPRAQVSPRVQLSSKHPLLILHPALYTSQPASVQAAAARVSERLKGARLNLLINNAGMALPSTLKSEKPEDMAEVYKTNVIGPMVVSQVFLPLLRKAAQESPQKGMSCSKAAIINMSSEAGSIANLFAWEYGQVVNYRCSKAALNMLTRCQSLIFAKEEILCSAVHPGWLKTDMSNHPLISQGNLVTLKQLIHKQSGAGGSCACM